MGEFLNGVNYLVDEVDVLVGQLEVKLDFGVVDGKVRAPLVVGARHTAPVLFSVSQSNQATRVAAKRNKFIRTYHTPFSNHEKCDYQK